VRLGVDASLVSGPLSVKGEFLRASDERTRQGLRDEDLPDVVASGWYVIGTGFVVGRLKSNGFPRTPVGGGGAGAIQLVARLESLAFASHAPGEPPLRNPRAANVLPNDIRAATFGLNWFPIRFVKVQWNLIREHLQDPERRPDPARAWNTGTVFRAQFAM
jgi:phosphate-selective porin